MKFLVLGILVCFVSVCSAADLTRLPQATGPDVVEAVVNIIRESCLFADDKRFLRRLAYVESHDGTSPRTFRSGYYGGIWQVDLPEFRETQNQASLSLQYNIIRNVMGIDWNSVQWVDLQRPLYSGIAAALYSLKKSAPSGVSWKKEEQGQFWAAYFHKTTSTNTASNFSQLAEILDQGCTLHQRVDLVFVVDSSSSLTSDDFERAKYFMKTIVEGFNVSPSQTQVGLIVYSSATHVQFYLNNYRDRASVENAIDRASYNPGSTQTGQAIDKAVQDVYSSAHGARNDAVKVMIVVTDGDSDDVIDTRHAAERAHADSIVTFSVGVGQHIHSSELQTIASNPSCTHVYKVKDYSEIRFMKEEIQKATCIAPLYINQTFTCAVGHCPPIAILTGPTGVTVKTNVTCGGVNVFSSVTNPYPSSAQYEWKQNTLLGHPVAYYYNITDKTLYVNMKDNQLFGQVGGVNIYNGSAGCQVTITPCAGDCTDQTVTVKCYRGGVEIPCDPSYYNCTEKWNFANPCTDAAIRQGITRFPHPYFSNRFLMCDYTKKLYVVMCPPGEAYVSDCSQCIGESTKVTASKCGTSVSSNITNPCTRENILADKMFFPYPGDVHRYIHCDVWGKPWERSCPGTEVWDQAVYGCRRDSIIDHRCEHHVPGTPYLYAHYCDPHRYIHCDTNDQLFIQSCQLDYLFLPASQTCIPPTFPGAETLVNTCSGAGTTASPQVTTPTYTVRPSYQYETGPTNSYGYAFPLTQWGSPCTLANIKLNELYFPYAYNIHQYIQCDLYGNAYLRTCSGGGRDYYDPYSHTCVDGPVFVDGILTRAVPIG